MAIQKKVLAVEADGSTVKKSGGTTAILTGSRGVLALGKPGDIASRAYGPVVRASAVTAATNFGAFVTGKGILVNSDDCAAVGNKFDTVSGLVAGQVGSFLISGAAIVKKSQLAAITAGMKVQEKIGEDSLFDGNWKKFVTWTANVAYDLGDYVIDSGAYYKCTTATSGDASFPTAKFTAISGTPAVFDGFAAYAADTLVKESASATDVYANPVALDGVIEVEVNGLA